MINAFIVLSVFVLKYSNVQCIRKSEENPQDIDIFSRKSFKFLGASIVITLVDLGFSFYKDFNVSSLQRKNKKVL